jgi:hypothetical protein
MGNPERFPPRVFFRKAAGEELPRGGDAVELQREFGTLIPHPDELCDQTPVAQWNRI